MLSGQDLGTRSAGSLGSGFLVGPRDHHHPQPGSLGTLAIHLSCKLPIQLWNQQWQLPIKLSLGLFLGPTACHYSVYLVARQQEYTLKMESQFCSNHSLPFLNVHSMSGTLSLPRDFNELHAG